MRELKDIQNDIDKLKLEINVLKDKLSVLYREKTELRASNFEQQYGIKHGDLVELSNGVKVYYDCHKYFGAIVRSQRKNGQPSHRTETVSAGYFDGCKVIGHAELM